jgi:hypothetical protein
MRQRCRLELSDTIYTTLRIQPASPATDFTFRTRFMYAHPEGTPDFASSRREGQGVAWRVASLLCFSSGRTVHVEPTPLPQERPGVAV